MTPNVIRYPLDPTGVSPDNLVQGELQTMVQRKVRAIAPDYGAFFSESLIITDQTTGLPLTPDQFYAAELYDLPTARYGKEICAIILITDETVSSTVALQYQALGGEYSTSQQAIINQIEALNLDDRPVRWGDLVSKPSAYPPSQHLHDIGDVYGFEYVVHALDRIRAAIMLGDDISHDTIYAYVDTTFANINAGIIANTNLINDHKADLDNPHHVTAAQIGSYTIPQTTAAIQDAITAASAPINTRIDNTNAAYQSADATQVALITVLQQNQKQYSTSGVGADYVIAPGSQPADFVNLPQYHVIFQNACAGVAATIKIGTLAAVSLFQYDSSGNKVNPTIVAGQVSDVIYDGTDCVLSNRLPPLVKQDVTYSATIPATNIGTIIYVPTVGILEWVATARYTGYRCKEVGLPILDSSPTLRGYELDLNGGTVSKTTYASLWAWALDNNFVVTAGNWAAGLFAFVDQGGDNFRLPDLRNQFFRASGTNADNGAARNIGTSQGTSNLSHGHSAASDTQGTHQHGTSWGESSDASRYGIYDYAHGYGSADSDFDNLSYATSANGAHLHNITVYAAGGNESRPINTAFAPRIHI